MFVFQALITACDSLSGELVANALDFVSKEVVRVSEQNSIAALVRSAAFARRHRECEESGRRQAEDLLRHQRDAIYNDILSQHSITAHNYLEELFDNAVNIYSHNSAKLQSAIKNDNIDTILSTVEHKDNDADTIIQDLVTNFLFTEVVRRHETAAKQLRQRRYINAAHNTLIAAVENVAQNVSNNKK